MSGKKIVVNPQYGTHHMYVSGPGSHVFTDNEYHSVRTLCFVEPLPSVENMELIYKQINW